MIKLAMMFLAGGVGTMARYVFSGIFLRAFGTDFPYGTLIINLLGCFLAGFLEGIPDARLGISAQMKIFLMIGFLGAFTTFSAFMVETAQLMKGGHPSLALLNVIGSVCIGFLVFYIGIFLGKGLS